MNKPHKYPLFEITIDEKDEIFVDAVALVDRPAIESNFLAFSNEAKELTFSINEERKELIGAALIPNLKIFRKSQDGTPYEVFFSEATIRNIAQVFFKKGFQNNINLNHTEDSADSYVFQSYIVDQELGISSPQGLNLPNGSWVLGMKVVNPDTWSKIKSKEIQGFSVEGIFNLTPTDLDFSSERENDEKEVLTLLQNLNSIIFKNEKP